MGLLYGFPGGPPTPQWGHLAQPFSDCSQRHMLAHSCSQDGLPSGPSPGDLVLLQVAIGDGFHGLSSEC